MAAGLTGPPPAARGLARTVAAMQWALYKRRATGGRLAANILFGVAGALGAIGMVLGGVAAGAARDPDAGAWVAASLVALGAMWAYLPAMSGFSDSVLQPRQFTLLPLPAGGFARALFTASLIGIPVPLTLVASLAVVGYAAVRDPATVLLALPAAPLTALFVVALSRVIALALSQAVRSRRAREAALLLFVAGFCALYAAQFALNDLIASASGAPMITYAIPFAWGLTAVERAAEGDWAVAAAALLGLAALTALTLAAWQWLVRRLFTGQVPLPTGSGRTRDRTAYRRAGWRATPLGAVVTRELSLWFGDVRRRYQLLMPIAFAVMSGVIPLFSEDFPFNARWGPWMALLMSVMAALNLYGLDGKAFWHLAMIPSAAGPDVRGRQIAWALVNAPIAIAAAVVVRAFGADPLDRVAVPAAVIVCMLGVGGGLVAYASVAAPYPVPEARKMMSFSTRNSAGGAAIGWSFGSMGVLAVTTVPCALLAALLPGPAGWLGVPAALVVGGVAWWWLGVIATRKLVARPDLIQYAVTRA
ncbi:hypothetical protein [Tsukamurella sp. 1534]|uniref:hypothetical protein n=1 Tax=Tsukamurella sp. 1534 TaxID=1151061 RepID=UPI0011D2667F|nr:hypothetical protein [Tsukamurella sp. 1534]